MLYIKTKLSINNKLKTKAISEIPSQKKTPVDNYEKAQKQVLACFFLTVF